ncbi:hypothetical protein [Pelosinus sp. sgz500959]|uniref:hypothetical protein n=1 Tax=Pelosinus sp. sgz500959 TaxID=3242472 RepID=UPI00366C0E8E
MIKNENFNKSEELSQCLDHLNAGQYPIVDDEEIKALIDVAALAKQSYGQEELPKALIDEVVDKLANEFQTKKQRKKQTKWKRWLYDGLAGAAAVVLIVGATQFLLPKSGDQQIAENVDEHVDTQKMVAVVDQPNNLMSTEPKKITLPQQVQEVHEADRTKVTMPIMNEKNSGTTASKVLAEIINVPESPKIEEKQVAMLQEERPKELVMRKSVSMAKTSINSLQEEKNVEPESKMMMMVLPHQVAQSITRDHTSGDIKQIYYLGNHDDHDEILITQRVSDESKVKSGVLTRKTKDGINSVTIQVNKYDITVEGKKTSEELKKIAESLIEIEKTINSKK